MSKSLKKQLELLGLKGSEKKLYPPKKRTKTLQSKKSLDSTTNQRKHTKTTQGNNHKINPEDKIARASFAKSMRNTYGNQNKPKVTKSLDRTVESPLIEFPLSLDDVWKHSHNANMLLLPTKGCAKQSLNWAGDVNIMDQINVGFDFGTSAIKVMLRSSDENLIPVKFTSDLNNPYVLPSCLYVNDGNASLHQTLGSEAYQNLKLSILEDNKSELDIVRAATFIALALRLVRGWLFENYHNAFEGKFLVWELNFGVPAVVHDNKETMIAFKDLFELAYFVSTQNDVEININTVLKFWRLRSWEVEDVSQNVQHKLSVVPEIAAQFLAVLKSDSWDQSHRLVSVVDIGAGTVDMGAFSITGKHDAPILHSLKTSVELNGVVHLHRDRIKQMLQTDSNANGAIENYLKSLLKVSDFNKPIPAQWTDYLSGTKLVKGIFNSDDEFDKHKYSSQVIGLLTYVKKHKYPNPEEWKFLPVLICGGGESTKLYKRLYDRYSKKAESRNMGFKVIPLITPLKVRDSGLTDLTYKRMSLAYGLSFSFDLFPKFVRESEISDFHKPVIFNGVKIISKDDI